MSEFKAGDKVRVNYEGYASWNTEIASTRTSGYSRETQYKLKEWRDGNPGGLHWSNSKLNMELIKENTMEATRENLNTHTIYVAKGNSYFKKGTEVRVKHDDGSNVPLFATLDGSMEYYVHIDEFTIFGTEPEIKEVTLEEVAESMGIDVKQLRIKE